jgi:carboxymethylenebutenolidase
MIEQFIDITTADSTSGKPMVTFVAHPDSGGPHPLVLFFMDAPGMREEIRDMARRLATAGYYVMAPHLYYREVSEYNVFDTGDRDRMFELMSGLSTCWDNYLAKSLPVPRSTGSDSWLTPTTHHTCNSPTQAARSTSARLRLTAMRPRR